MKRFSWLALLFVIATGAARAAHPWDGNCVLPMVLGQSIDGVLATSDCYWWYNDTPSELYYTDVYSFSATAGQKIYVSMNAPNFDAYLEIYNVNDWDADPLVADDDSGGAFNARIPGASGYYTIPATGTYYIWAQAFDPNAAGTGTYTLALDTDPPSPPTVPATVTVSEFYHGGFDHYFITAYPSEAASLAAGNLPPWVSTTLTFRAWSGPGTVAGVQLANVCRFFSDTFAPKSGHFYSHNLAECPGLAAGGVWKLEANNAFYMMPPPASGACPAGTVPLYRLYNNGMGGAPNHRYTTSFDLRGTMIASGWSPEGSGDNGVFACVPQ